MSETRQPLRRTIRGGRPFFFADPATDKVLNMVVTLASEVWALRERLAAVEGAQRRRGTLEPTEIDDFEFSPEDEARLGADRKEFIENLFRVLQEQVDAAVAKSATARKTMAQRPGVFGARVATIRKSKAAASGARSPKRRKR